MWCKRAGTGCLEPSVETSLRAQLSLQQYPGRLSKIVWERFLPSLSPHFATTLSWRRQEVMETRALYLCTHRLCTPALHRLYCLRANTLVERGRKRGLWPDGSSALSHSFRGMLQHPNLPPWSGSRGLKIQRRHNGTKITSLLRSFTPCACTDNRSS